MAGDEEVFEGLIRLLAEGRRVALCTVIEKRGSGPREIGAKMLVEDGGETLGTIGGGNMERALIGEALGALREGRPKKAVFALHGGSKGEDVIETGLICGGEVTVFIDVVEPRPRLVVVGSGHIALPLSRLADMAGFDVVIVDDQETATHERFPMAKGIVTGRFDEALERVEVRPSDFVAIVHGEPEHDYTALARMTGKRPAYIGLLGSRAKIRALQKRLLENGFSPGELEGLHAPIGLDIGAVTPEEIGVSIIAEMIRERRRGGG